jgi:ABC-type microcin C transport system permease subunit YejB
VDRLARKNRELSNLVSPNIYLLSWRTVTWLFVIREGELFVLDGFPKDFISGKFNNSD